jgi:serine protease Do
MEELQLLDAVERYLRGEMNPQEKASLEQLRSQNPELDQMFVEQTFFLQQLNEFGENKQFRNNLHEVHHQLLDSGEIQEIAPRAKVVDMMKKYRRILAIAACVAGIIAITVSGLVAYFATPRNNSNLEFLTNKYIQQERKQNSLSNQINQIKNSITPPNTIFKSGGTSFLIDPRGYLVTNAHVLKDARHVVVQNMKGQEFKVTIIKMDEERDLAFLKIDSDQFKPMESLPYGFKKNGAELGEQLFTLGFPRETIVYGEGYLSAKTGYQGDTLSCQIAIAANPGNSGGPVFNKNGELIGILSTRQLQAQGFVFAVTTRNILKSLEDLKKDSIDQFIKPVTSSAIKNLERTKQIEKIEDYVFMVKTY